MAKGKHGARKLNRDAERLARQLEEARADLASEQRRLRAADAEVARVDGIRQQLTQALNERDSAVAGEVTRCSARSKC
jgi:chromosome segregation ATPase